MTGKALLVAAALLAAGPIRAQTTDKPAEAAAPAASAAPAETPAPSGAKVIYIFSQMRFAEGIAVDPAVRSECQLPTQGAELLESAARDAGINIARNDVAAKSGKGRAFEVEITGVTSAGNAFTGHHKVVSVRGRLLDDGKEIAVFDGSRNSNGGWFGPYKGSCSVLARCLEALGKDMATWLKQPR